MDDIDVVINLTYLLPLIRATYVGPDILLMNVSSCTARVCEEIQFSSLSCSRESINNDNLETSDIDIRDELVDFGLLVVGCEAIILWVHT